MLVTIRPVIPKLKPLSGLAVSVDEVIYMPDLDAPPERPYPFIYFITIKNESPMAVTIRGRKWVVRQEDTEVIVVEGEGVVGQSPRLAPGEDFSYNSKHYVSCSSEAEGAFFVEADDGRHFYTLIPRFPLRLPEWV
jgi:ApaG protein